MRSLMVNENLPKIDKDWVDKHIGLVCPSCGGSFWIVTNTIRRANEVHRRRVCRHCQYVLHTVEKANS